VLAGTALHGLHGAARTHHPPRAVHAQAAERPAPETMPSDFGLVWRKDFGDKHLGATLKFIA
jgi:hypothetical protein